MKKATIYYVYSIYAYWPHRDEAHSFYFEEKQPAEEVRQMIFNNSDKLGRNHSSYCSHVSVPSVATIKEEDLPKVYKTASEFIDTCDIYKNLYGQNTQEEILER